MVVDIFTQPSIYVLMTYISFSGDYKPVYFLQIYFLQSYFLISYDPSLP